MIQALRRYSIKDVPFHSKPKNKYNEYRSAFNIKPVRPQGLIHNPPAAAQSVKETPLLFLPKHDPRATILKDTYKVYTPEELADMPLIYGIKREKDYSLTPDIVQEIVKLRHEDPETWTVSKLAAKFNVDMKKVNVLTGISKERQAQVQKQLDLIKETWKEKRRVARSDREKRTQMWLRNEI